MHRMDTIPLPHQKQREEYLCPCISVEQELCVSTGVQVAPHCAPSCAALWCTECVGSLIVSLSRHFNGRGTLVSGPGISMVKLFPLRGYFHWPNSIFPFTPSNLCKKTASCVFPFPIRCLVIQGARSGCALMYLLCNITGRCALILKK